MNSALPLSIALGLMAATFTPQTAAAAELVSGSYQEAIRCSAIDTVMLGVARQDDESKMSAEDKANAVLAEKHAVGWLVMAIQLNPKGEEPAKADFAKDILDVASMIMAAKDADALDTAIGADMMHCIKRESELFK